MNNKLHFLLAESKQIHPRWWLLASDEKSPLISPRGSHVVTLAFHYRGLDHRYGEWSEHRWLQFFDAKSIKNQRISLAVPYSEQFVELNFVNGVEDISHTIRQAESLLSEYHFENGRWVWKQPNDHKMEVSRG